MWKQLEWTLAGTLGLALLAGTAPARGGDYKHGDGKGPDQFCRSIKLDAVIEYYGCLVRAADDHGKQFRCDDRFARQFKRAEQISPGCEPLDNLRRTQLGVQNQAREALVGAINQPPCAAVLSSNNTVTCQLMKPGQLTGISEVDLSALLTQVQQTNANITDTTVMWMQAWGGSGGNSHDYSHGGAGGFAQSVTSISDLENRQGALTLYYYLGSSGTYTGLSGGQGGAATLVTTQDLTQNPSTEPEQSAILLMAGGGGGSGGDGNGLKGCLGESPAYGGEGGVAIATTGPDGEGIGQGANASSGGYGGGQGIGAGHGQDGIGGSGGKGGSGYNDQPSGNPGWVNTGTISLTFTSGQGGPGASDNNVCASGGGGGGGGWGGGDGGSHGNESTHADSGGGGGSYSIASTQSDGDAPTSKPSNPNGGTGFFQLVFNLTPK